MFMTFDRHEEFVSAAWLYELLAVNQGSLSECEELNWFGYLYKGLDDGRGGNANDLYGAINRTYIFMLKDAHDLCCDLDPLSECQGKNDLKRHFGVLVKQR